MINQVAIVTGGTRGIGLAVSEMLLEEGYQLMLFGRSAPEAVQEPLAQLSEMGTVQYFRGDIANIDDINRCVSQASGSGDPIGLLVNNAGVAPPVRKPLLETTEENFDFVIDRNLRGTFFMTQAVARKMALQKAGMIVNISSMSAETSSVNRGEYCISKAGISMITKLFADEMSKYGVPVYEVRPGIIKTEMTAAAAETYDALLKEGAFPIKRWGLPEDVAKCVRAFVAGLLPYSTGEVLNVDGGFHLRRL